MPGVLARFVGVLGRRLGSRHGFLVDHVGDVGRDLGRIGRGHRLPGADVDLALGAFGCGLLLFRQVFEHAEHALGAALADGLHVAAFLQQLAAHVERQVGRVDHALHEAQVARQQRLGIVHDEDALHVELDARALVAVPQVEGGLGRNVEQLRVLGAAFHAVVAPGERCLVVVADALVERFVLLGRDVFLGAAPQGVGLVDRFPFAGLDHVAGLVVLAFLPFLFFHEDGQRDVVGILADDLLELPGVEVFVGVVAQVQRDAGAALRARDVGHLEVARAGARPAHALLGRQARAARFDRDPVGHDEARIEAHAELADELAEFRSLGLLLSAELAHEVLGTTLGDGAEVVDGFLARQADALVGDGDGARGLVESEAHIQVGLVFVQLGMIDGLEAQLVAGVRSVRDQLAQEDFLVGIQRMRDEVQKLRDFSLEREFRVGGISHGKEEISN